MSEFRLEEKIDELFDKVGFDEGQKQKYWSKINEDLDKPVKMIGAGQTGVGKTTLLRSIFAIEEEDIPDEMTTDPVDPETDSFQSFKIENEDGFAIQFTDGPGLGEDLETDEKYISMWIEEIPNHDLLYWVVDASSRDISHIQRNMKRILDNTGYRDKIIVVLNKVDKIELDREDREDSKARWDEDYNLPTDELEEQIDRRTEHLIDKFSDIGISEDQIVACSALKRWNTMEVVKKLINGLPEEKRIKAAANRDVDDFTDLMSEDALEELADASGSD